MLYNTQKSTRDNMQYINSMCKIKMGGGYYNSAKLQFFIYIFNLEIVNVKPLTSYPGAGKTKQMKSIPLSCKNKFSG